MNTGKFVEGVILGINSLINGEMELGKELATALEPILAGDADASGKTDQPSSWWISLEQLIEIWVLSLIIHVSHSRLVGRKRLPGGGRRLSIDWRER